VAYDGLLPVTVVLVDAPFAYLPLHILTSSHEGRAGLEAFLPFAPAPSRVPSNMAILRVVVLACQVRFHPSMPEAAEL